jgi:hypothetical protein
MDRRIIAILGVSIIEIAMRLFYKHLGIDPLLYTLTARLIQAALIIGTASGCSGIKTKSVTKKSSSGLAVLQPSVSWSFLQTLHQGSPYMEES